MPNNNKIKEIFLKDNKRILLVIIINYKYIDSETLDIYCYTFYIYFF